MYRLAARYSHKMKVEVIGRSWEGRDIRVVTVGNRLASGIEIQDKISGYINIFE